MLHSVPKDVVSSNPDFSLLINDLFKNHLTQEGYTKEMAKELEQEQSILQRERTGYLESLLVYEELKELIYNHEAEKENLSSRASGQSLSAFQADTKLFDRVGQLMDMFEAGQSLDMQTSCIERSKIGGKETRLEVFTKSGTAVQIQSNDCQLLGCTHDMLLRVNSLSQDQIPKEIRSLQEQVIPKIEASLSKKVDFLTEAFSQRIGQSGELLDLVTQTVARIKQASRDLVEAKQETSAQFDKFVESARQVLTVLTDIVENYMLTYQDTYDEAMRQWMRLRCATLAAKMEVIKHRCLVKTYTPSIVSALRKTKGLLEVEAKEAQDVFLQSQDKLSQYERVGMGFDKLVTEYAELVTKIDSFQWNLQQMQS